MKYLPGSLKTVGTLASLRAMALLLMLGQNVLLLKGLTLAEVGEYYLISTISYLGNAAVFVGADLYLQRRSADTLRSGFISGRGALSYFSATTLVGGSIVLCCAGAYFWFRLGLTWQLPLVCVFMSVAVYASGLVRNLLQLAGQAKSVATVSLAEAMLKFVAASVAIALGANSGLQLVIAVTAGSAIAAITGLYFLLAKVHTDSNESYLGGIKGIIGRVVPVGGTGLLNWAQLQGYRPLTIGSAGAEVIGSVAFLSSLGSTVANAVYGILAQMQIPKVYATKGKSSLQYLKLTGFLALALSALSVPAGFVFLHATHHENLLSFLFLIPVGVLVESGNAFVGVAIAHSNSVGRALWHFSACGAIGCAVTIGILLFPAGGFEPQFQIAGALLVGQFIASFLACAFTFAGLNNS